MSLPSIFIPGVVTNSKISEKLVFHVVVVIPHEFQSRDKIMQNWWFLMYLSIPGLVEISKFGHRGFLENSHETSSKSSPTPSIYYIPNFQFRSLPPLITRLIFPRNKFTDSRCRPEIHIGTAINPFKLTIYSSCFTTVIISLWFITSYPMGYNCIKCHCGKVSVSQNKCWTWENTLHLSVQFNATTVTLVG